jgi:Ca2+-binding EF-hand superfamily protein
LIGKPSWYNYYVFDKIFQEADKDKNGLLNKKELNEYF